MLLWTLMLTAGLAAPAETCVDGDPPPPARARPTESAKEQRARFARGELPTVLIPLDPERSKGAVPTGKYYDTDGEIYRFSEVELLLMRHPASRDHAERWRLAENNEQAARGQRRDAGEVKLSQGGLQNRASALERMLVARDSSHNPATERDQAWAAAHRQLEAVQDDALHHFQDALCAYNTRR